MLYRRPPNYSIIKVLLFFLSYFLKRSNRSKFFSSICLDIFYIRAETLPYFYVFSVSLMPLILIPWFYRPSKRTCFGTWSLSFPNKTNRLNASFSVIYSFRVFSRLKKSCFLNRTCCTWKFRAIWKQTFTHSHCYNELSSLIMSVWNSNSQSWCP